MNLREFAAHQAHSDNFILLPPSFPDIIFLKYMGCYLYRTKKPTCR